MIEFIEDAWPALLGVALVVLVLLIGWSLVPELACIDGKVWHVHGGIATPPPSGLVNECRIVAEAKP